MSYKFTADLTAAAAHRARLYMKRSSSLATSMRLRGRYVRYKSEHTRPTPKKLYATYGATALFIGGAALYNVHRLLEQCEGHTLSESLRKTNSETTASSSKMSTSLKEAAASKKAGDKLQNDIQQENQSQKDQPSKDKPLRDASPEKPLYNKDEPLCFVVGSGIDYSHREFDEGQVLELTSPKDDSTPVLRRSTFRLPNDLDNNDRCFSHETNVASIVAGKRVGVAPGTKLVDVRVEFTNTIEHRCALSLKSNERRFRDIKSFLKANPGTTAVITMSLGQGPKSNVHKQQCKCYEAWTFPRTVARCPRTDVLIREIYEMGVLTISASGNECIPAYMAWPTSNPYVLSVGAVDGNGEQYARNNFAVDLLARGVDVSAGSIPPDTYKTATGTSFAAPYIAGQACKILANKSAYPVLQITGARPGALKRLLFIKFEVEQGKLAQDHYAKRRSDGVEVNEAAVGQVEEEVAEEIKDEDVDDDDDNEGADADEVDV